MLIYPTSSSSRMLISTFLNEEQCKLVILIHYYYFIYCKVKLLSLYTLLHLLSYYSRIWTWFSFFACLVGFFWSFGFLGFFVNWDKKVHKIILHSSTSQFVKHATVWQAHYPCQYICLCSINFFPSMFIAHAK